MPTLNELPLLELTRRLQATRICVAGDLILDHYIHGTAERISPEAPVPVVLSRHEESVPGGAANVARNVLAFGAGASCIGVVGRDSAAAKLRGLLEVMGADCSGLVEDGSRPTTMKTRVLAQGHQMLRVDHENVAEISAAVEDLLLRQAASLMAGANAVIMSDYAKGTLNRTVVARLIEAAAHSNIPVFVDPKLRDYSRYTGATVLTPNAREAQDATGQDGTAENWAEAAARTIAQTTGARWIVITRGADGFTMFERESGCISEPASAREVFDVTGAGDTFVAFLAMATAAGFGAGDSCRIANAAASVVVAKIGAAVVQPWELRGALAPGARGRKLRSPSELAALGAELRAAGKKIVFTNGCFDFIHAGHVSLLQQARALGDVLVLATNTDEVIARLKGAPRPIVKQGQREQLLAAIEAVDYVVPFDDPTPHALLESLRPDVLVKGDNYTRGQVEGHEVVEAHGGSVVMLPTIESISTADLVGRLGQPGT